MEVAKACAETMLIWIARYQMWSQQVDEYFEYKLLDKKLSMKANKARFKEYTELQRSLHTWMNEAIQHVLACYGVGKDEMSILLQQLVVAAQKGLLGEQVTNMLLGTLGGVPVLDGNTTGSVSDGATDDKDPANNWTLKLLTASLLDKAVTYKMPHPDVHIEGVPDEEEQATPREHIRRTVQSMMPRSGTKKIQ
jgi:hypothetical protein